MTPAECGAACLAMILSFHRMRITLGDVRRTLDPGRDGSTARAIADAARSFGLQVHAYSARAADLSAVSVPAILHWDAGHFVVLERIAKGTATVVDPAWGREKVSNEELASHFAGVVLELMPGPTFATTPATRTHRWEHVLAEVRRFRGTITVVLISSILLQVTGLFLPIVTAITVDRLIPEGSVSGLTIIAILASLIVANQLVVSALRELLLIRLRARVELAVTRRLFAHLLTLPLGFFERREVGDLLARVSGLATIQQTMSGAALGVILDGSLAVVYIAILFTQSVVLAVLTLALAVLQGIASAWIMRRTALLVRRELAARAATQSRTTHILTGIGALKAAGAEDRAYGLWRDIHASEVACNIAVGRMQALHVTVSAAMRVLAPLSLLLCGSYLVIDGSLTMGAMFGLSALAATALGPLAAILGTAFQFQRVAAHLDRVVDILIAEPEQRPERHYRRASPESPRIIEFQHVSFRYAPGGPVVLDDVSLTITRGEAIGVAGTSGSGKTTLAKLVLGLYLPTLGDILYDGVPLAEYDLRALRRRFAAVLQETVVFGGSIWDNIVLHDPTLSNARVIEAAEMAALHEEVVTMPLGYRTPVGDHGSYLSGGQLQRLALARAFARRPTLMVLDEATSHLDTATESTIMANLARLLCTRIVIAHRLSTLREADRILVLERGRIVEDGPHRELQALNGHYARLVAKQLDSQPVVA